MGEAKKVEGLRFVAGSSSPRWPPEAHQPRFLSIDLQPETSKPLCDHPLDFMNILQSHLPMTDRVEKLAQIHLKNPLNFLRKALFSQVFQRLML
jgi:hypothetical protein